MPVAVARGRKGGHRALQGTQGSLAAPSQGQLRSLAEDRRSGGRIPSYDRVPCLSPRSGAFRGPVSLAWSCCSSGKLCWSVFACFADIGPEACFCYRTSSPRPPSRPTYRARIARHWRSTASCGTVRRRRVSPAVVSTVIASSASAVTDTWRRWLRRWWRR
jgi:hypothetical protein